MESLERPQIAFGINLVLNPLEPPLYVLLELLKAVMDICFFKLVNPSRVLIALRSERGVAPNGLHYPQHESQNYMPVLDGDDVLIFFHWFALALCIHLQASLFGNWSTSSRLFLAY